MECRIIMETRKLYEGLGENYDEVLSRFGTDLMVGRFALRFLEDPSFDSLTKGLDDNDAEKAFRGAHTLKGLCATLGFDQLSEKASALTESLRPRVIADEADPLYAATKKEYERVIAALKDFKAQQ